MSKGLAIVTGAAGGVGDRICARLSKIGYSVVGIDRAWESAPEYVNCREVCNITDLKAFSTVIAKIIHKFGSPQIVVSNAGGLEKEDFDTVTEFEIERCIHLNLTAPIILARSCVMHMTSSSLIVFISSISAIKGAPDHPAYSAAKSGLDGLTVSLAKKYGGKGIRVIAIAPGSIKDTDFNKDNWGHLSSAQQAAMKIQLSRSVPLKRLLMPDDVAKWIEFLAVQDIAMTGTTICVDGGEVWTP